MKRTTVEFTWSGFQDLQERIHLRGLQPKDCGLSRSLLNSWKSQSHPGELIRVEARTLANVCFRSGMDPEDIRDLSEGGRSEVITALETIRDSTPLKIPVPERLHGGRLLPIPSRLFGEATAYLRALDDAFANPRTRMVTICGFGGVGKSSLVGKWIHRLGKRLRSEPIRIFVASFKDKDGGSSTSSDEFLDRIRDWLGDRECLDYSADAKAVEIARLLGDGLLRTVLVLDSFESMLEPVSASSGDIKSDSMHCLLRILAERESPANNLCVLTSRLEIDNLAHFENSENTVRSIHLENLDSESGAAFLSSLGAELPPSQLHVLSQKCQGWPLALAIVGSRLTEGSAGPPPDLEELLRVAKFPRKGKAGSYRTHIEQLMQWCGRAYAEPAAWQLLRLLSCFDRAVDEATLRAIAFTRPPVPHATDSLPEDTRDWNDLVGYLKQARLIQVNVSEAQDREGSQASSSRLFDLHQLIHDWLQEDFKHKYPQSWQATIRRISDHLVLGGNAHPATFVDLMPFYRAAVHRCRVDDYSGAFWNVYWPHVVRTDPVTGEGLFVSLRQFGSYDAELSLLRHFFEGDHEWARVRPELDMRARGLVQGIVGFCLRAWRSLERALPLMMASYQALRESGDEIHACGIAGYASETLRTLGRLKEAREWAELCVNLADRIRIEGQIGHLRQRVYHRSTLADILRFQGELDQSDRVFVEARSLLPGGRLISIPSARWCELLLERQDFDSVIRQAEWILTCGDQRREAVSAGLHRLYLGSAQIRVAHHEEGRRTGLENVKLANQELVNTGLIEAQASGQVVLGRSLRDMQDLDGAEGAIIEGIKLSESCGAKLIEADCLLENAHIAFDRCNRGLPASLDDARNRLHSIRSFLAEEYRLRARDFIHLVHALGE
jgi:hypothetical protein